MNLNFQPTEKPLVSLESFSKPELKSYGERLWISNMDCSTGWADTATVSNNVSESVLAKYFNTPGRILDSVNMKEATKAMMDGVDARMLR